MICSKCNQPINGAEYAGHEHAVWHYPDCPTPLLEPNDEISNLFEDAGTNWEDFYEVHTLSSGEPDVECIHLTAKAREAIRRLVVEARYQDVKWGVEHANEVKSGEWADGKYKVITEHITELHTSSNNKQELSDGIN